MFDTVFMLCTPGSKIPEFSVWVIGGQNVIITYQGAAVPDNNIFPRFGTVYSGIKCFIILSVDQFIISVICAHSMTVYFFREQGNLIFQGVEYCFVVISPGHTARGIGHSFRQHFPGSQVLEKHGVESPAQGINTIGHPLVIRLTL